MTPGSLAATAPLTSAAPAATAAATTLLGTWSKPPDSVAWVAAGAAAAMLILAFSPTPVLEVFGLKEETHGADASHPRRFVLFAAFAAAFLSLGYIAVYLRGGPRIIDATTYFLQGRALAHGKLAWHALAPTGSFRGRFLLFHEPDRLAGIFPPGYPLLLAAGFLVGAPMVIGPLLAAGIAALTYLLARELTIGDPPSREAPLVPRLAVVLSVLSAALRYHTADTMAHGAAALGITLALVAALRARRTGQTRLFAIAGLAVGWVLCTRIVSALPIGAVVLALATRARARRPALGAALGAIVPGIVVLAIANRASTGSAFTFAQRAYYAVSDGPPGCFRYGFGASVGCLEEHGDFVRAHLAHGYGLVAALGTTLRRLRMHLLDVANFEPLALLVLVPVFQRARSIASIALALVVGQIATYAPFYFDGNYPGGGARFFADVLPMEHALIAIAVAGLATRIDFVRRALVLVSLVCAGFAVHAVHEHLALAARDGGQPAYEPDTGRDAQISHGLVFFSTDAGFNLAFDPAAEASHELFAARQRNDDHDRVLYDRLGHPPAYVYRQTATGSTLSPWVSTSGTSEDYWRFESEAEWPPLAQGGGWAEPEWLSGTCASGERALTLQPAREGPEGEATVTIDLPVPRDGRWFITPRVIRRGGSGVATLRLIPGGSTDATLAAPPAPDAPPKPSWTWNDHDGKDACNDITPFEATLVAASGARLVLTAKGGRVTLDRINLRATRPR